MKQSKISQNQAIAWLSGAAFASAASVRVCDPLLPLLAHTFNTSAGQAARVISIYSIVYGLFQLVFGPLGDRYGKYQVIAWTTLASTLGSLGCALATSLNVMVFARILAAATSAAIIPLSMAWIGDNVHYEERQPTLARFLSGQIIGVIGGQILGGFFADHVGWRGAFFSLAIIYLIVGIQLLRLIKDSPSLFTNTPESHLAPAKRLLSLAQFKSVLLRPWAQVVLLTVFLEGMMMFGALAFIPTFLKQRFGLSLAEAGAIVGCFGLGGLIYSVGARHFVRRWGERGLAVIGGGLMGLSYFLLYIAPAWPVAILVCLGLGAGFYFLHNSIQTNATQMAPEARGTAVSLYASTYYLGQAAGVAAAALIVDSFNVRSLFLIAAFGLPVIGGGFRWAMRHRNYA
jgi:MFS transporter, YNFM family, putative membrane transport protein